MLHIIIHIYSHPNITSSFITIHNLSLNVHNNIYLYNKQICIKLYTHNKTSVKKIAYAMKLLPCYY